MRISVFEVVGAYALTPEDGRSVYDRVHASLRSDDQVELDFDGVKVFASPFFNSAIGRLLADSHAEYLREHLKFQNISGAGAELLQRAIENAKEFFADPMHQQSISSAIVSNLLSA